MQTNTQTHAELNIETNTINIHAYHPNLSEYVYLAWRSVFVSLLINCKHLTDLGFSCFLRNMPVDSRISFR